MFNKDANEDSSAQPRPAQAAAGRNPAPSRSSGGATIGPSIKIKGDVSGDEDLLIQGQIEGKVKLGKHNVTIGSDGHVKADVHGRTVVVEGQVEGDLRERIGAPVRQGEVLLKLARLDPMYVEGKVDERNIHLLAEGREGEIAFASRPNEKFPITVERIEPLAIPEEGGNIFLVRCRITAEDNAWWRPGMSGLCKIDSERRSYLWMLTHRTVDFLRMKLWW